MSGRGNRICVICDEEDVAQLWQDDANGTGVVHAETSNVVADNGDCCTEPFRRMCCRYFRP